MVPSLFPRPFSYDVSFFIRGEGGGPTAGGGEYGCPFVPGQHVELRGEEYKVAKVVITGHPRGARMVPTDVYLIKD